jgi:uncharacterized membrane protein
MHVSLARPFIWLSRGWEDLRRTPRASLAYGLLVSALGAVILGFWRHPLLGHATWHAYRDLVK